jgi:hypothetical protein
VRAVVYFGGGPKIAVHAGYSKGALASIIPTADHLYGVSAGSLWALIEATIGTDAGIALLGTITSNDSIYATKDKVALAGDLLFRAGDGFILGYAPLLELLKTKIPPGVKKPVTVGRVQNNTMRLQHVTAWPDGTFTTDADDLGPITTWEEFLLAVLSSCLTYPIVDMYVDPAGKFWQDGGFREGGPVVRAILDGATELHICMTGEYSSNCAFDNTTGGDPINCSTRTLEGMANQNVIGSVNDAVENPALSVFVYKCTPQGSGTVFDQVDIQANIKIGQAVTAIAGKDLVLQE